MSAITLETSFMRVLEYFQFHCPYDARFVSLRDSSFIIAINMKWLKRIMGDLVKLRAHEMEKPEDIIVKFITFKEAKRYD